MFKNVLKQMFEAVCFYKSSDFKSHDQNAISALLHIHIKHSKWPSKLWPKPRSKQ